LVFSHYRRFGEIHVPKSQKTLACQWFPHRASDHYFAPDDGEMVIDTFPTTFRRWATAPGKLDRFSLIFIFF
jgi:hypothetical protein